MSEITLKSAWQGLVGIFKDAKLKTPLADARLLVQHALNISHEDLLMNGDRPVTTDEQAQLADYAKRRLSHEPVARIIGRRAFWKSDFIVTPAVLDPRADSEILVEAALHHVHPQPARVLDLGTGTGCLLLSLLLEWKDATGVGLDISAAAAAVATQNRDALGLQARAEIVATDWAAYQPDALFDVVVSNPPYIAHEEAADLAPDVRDFDPPEALFAGDHGLAAYKSILEHLPRLLRGGGWLFLEIGYTQERPVRHLLEEAGLSVVEARQDLGGHPRILVAQRPLLQ